MGKRYKLGLWVLAAICIAGTIISLARVRGYRNTVEANNASSQAKAMEVYLTDYNDLRGHLTDSALISDLQGDTVNIKDKYVQTIRCIEQEIADIEFRVYEQNKSWLQAQIGSLNTLLEGLMASENMDKPTETLISIVTSAIQHFEAGVDAIERETSYAIPPSTSETYEDLVYKALGPGGHSAEYAKLYTDYRLALLMSSVFFLGLVVAAMSLWWEEGYQ